MPDRRIEIRGERQSDRDAMNRLEKRLVDHGMDPRKAHDKARERARACEHKVKRRE